MNAILKTEEIKPCFLSILTYMQHPKNNINPLGKMSACSHFNRSINLFNKSIILEGNS